MLFSKLAEQFPQKLLEDLDGISQVSASDFLGRLDDFDGDRGSVTF